VLRDGVDARPPAPATPTRRRALVIGGVTVFALLAGVALASALGARLPGQTSSGNTGARAPATVSASTERQQLEAAVARNPSDVPTRLLLARALEANNDLAGALAQYDQIVKLDPTNAEAEAQAGRILYLTAQAAPASQAGDLVNRSRARLDHAVQLNSQYPDAHFFRAIVLANEFQDFAGAQNDAQRYLILAPTGVYADQDRALLAQVTSALQPTSPTTTPRKATP
jgi:cytochrome c-type biogenesis protein CcmH/NrfG